MKFLRKPLARLWTASQILVILLGLLVLGIRLALTLADGYREPVARTLGEWLGARARIEKLEARLVGLAPEVRLVGVVLEPRAGGSQLAFRELRLRLDPWASLRQGQPRLALATLVGARLWLRREADGRLRLFDLGGVGGDQAQAELTPLPLFSQARLRLLDSELRWENRRLGLPPLTLSGLEGELANDGERHRLYLRATQVGTEPGVLEVRGAFRGLPDQPKDWRGDLYLQGRDLALAPLVDPLLTPGMALGGAAELEIWSHWGPGGPLEANGRLNLSAPRLTAPEAPALAWDGLSACLAWWPEADGWRLGVRDLRLTRDGQTSPPSELALWLRREAGMTRLYAGADRLALADLARLAQVWPLEERQRRALTESRPRGQVQDPRLTLDLAEDASPRWWLQARLDDLALEPWAGIPGVRGLDLDLRAKPGEGWARLASEKLDLRFPTLFRGPLKADHLAGELRWRAPPGQGLELTSDEIILESPDLLTRSRLKLIVPEGGGSPFIDMQTDFREGNGAEASHYLPVGILSAPVVGWLDRALVGGRVSSGGFLLRGRMADFPFYNRAGRFQVLFGVEDLTLDYQAAWPRLEEVTAEVLFLNEGLEARVREGRILESRVRDARVWIPDLDAKVIVQVAGQIQGPFRDVLRVLRETPLADRQARYVQGMEGLGEGRVDLELSLPVEGVGEYRVDGRLRWGDGPAALRLADWNLTLERLRGVLRFTDAGLFAENIRAQGWGQPLRLDVVTVPETRGKAANTQVRVALPLNRRLAARLPKALGQALSGEGDGRLELEIEHTAPERPEIPLRYRFSSDLRGIGLDLPDPLGKPAAEARPLTLAGALPLASANPVTAAYGDLAASLRLVSRRGRGLTLRGGAIQLGATTPPTPPDAGLRLEGRLARLDLDAWWDWLARFPDASEADWVADLAPQARLAVSQLNLGRTRFTGVDLEARRTANAWELEVAADQLAGTLRWPERPRLTPIQGRLKFLRLDWPEGTSPAPSPTPSLDASPARLLDPTTAPGLDLRVVQIYLKDQKLGELNLRARAVPDGLRLERLRLEGSLLDLEGEGAWTGTPGRQRSRLALRAHSPALGKTLADLGLTQALGEAETHLTTDLNWPAAPLGATPGNLEGTLEVRLNKGRVLEMDPGVGRILGLFNLGALGRRLSLDFSDLFKSGYAFDRIDGRFLLADGEARIERLTIQGPAAQVAVTGRTGLVTRDYHQEVTVTPDVSGVLPVAGALAGGPLAGAVLLLADRVLGDEVDKLIRYRYSVTGPWEDPVFQYLEGQGGPLAGLARPGEESSKPKAGGAAALPPARVLHGGD